MRRLLALSILVLASGIPARLRAQEVCPTCPASITVSAEGNVTVTPDIATVHLSVVTHSPTAHEAGQLNARTQRAVLDTLHDLRVPAERITTSGYSLRPEYRYAPNRVPELTGYIATNTVTVELHAVDQVGAIIDAALARGANEVAGLSFSYSGADKARRDAIAKAVEKARADADAAAHGAGLTLGALQAISVSSPQYPSPVNYNLLRASSVAADMGTPTPIEAGGQAVRVSVSTRWGVLPPQ